MYFLILKNVHLILYIGCCWFKSFMIWGKILKTKSLITCGSFKGNWNVTFSRENAYTSYLKMYGVLWSSKYEQCFMKCFVVFCVLHGGQVVNKWALWLNKLRGNWSWILERQKKRLKLNDGVFFQECDKIPAFLLSQVASLGCPLPSVLTMIIHFPVFQTKLLWFSLRWAVGGERNILRREMLSLLICLVSKVIHQRRLTPHTCQLCWGPDSTLKFKKWEWGRWEGNFSYNQVLRLLETIMYILVQLMTKMVWRASKGRSPDAVMVVCGDAKITWWWKLIGIF